MRIVIIKAAVFFFAYFVMAKLIHAASAEDLARQLTNPVANLISVPFQFNYNTHINPENSGHQTYLNIQPVIPFGISQDWNIISRTILPVMDQVNILPHTGTQFGLGDTLQSLFLSPKKGSIIWGVGPAISIPTDTNPLLGNGKWGLGPTVVALKMSGPWTVGVLANQVWSVSQGERTSTNQAFVQPFLAYTTKSAWTFTLNSESTYDWIKDDLSAPVNLLITKLIAGKVPVSLGAGLRYWITTPDTGPKDFGARFVVTFLFPKG